jgi:rhodanese-related sulfurtransferase
LKKYLFIAAIIILLAVSGAYLVIIRSDNEQQVTENKQQATSLSARIETSNGQLIDVRTSEEFTSNHAQGALNVPLSDIQSGKVAKIDKSKPIYLYCRSGNRAGEAKALLEKAGYKDVTNIGGLDDWQSQGGKVCSSEAVSC